MRVETPEPPEDKVRLAGLREAVGPDGDTVAVRMTVPAKPLTLFSWSCEVPVVPLSKMIDVGFEDTEKSTTATVTCTE